MKLNLGAGHICPAGWVNVDGSYRAWTASKLKWLDQLLVSLKILPQTEFYGVVFADLTKRFIWNDDSVDAIYMGEILEHFTRSDGEHVIRECYRVLKDDGIIRIRVPDNAKFWRNYLEEYDAALSKPRDSWDNTHSRWVEMFFNDICVEPLRRFRSMGHFHKWMYDEISLILLLEKYGFGNIQRKAFQDSDIKNISAVEEREELIVEAKKMQSK